MYLPTPPHVKDATQGQFLTDSKKFNLEFSFFYTGCVTKTEAHSLPYY